MKFNWTINLSENSEYSFVLISLESKQHGDRFRKIFIKRLGAKVNSKVVPIPSLDFGWGL
ncbi:hypothetical protein UAY_03351 [Enterococcus moraviensis ATCC BAA-383]|uniref:Uncharacterized protein n=1 Tax=Enterococcus moraviensis ATCC BAA-383 TaxID=1158609 RepID=R2SL90_9ENTE|nr:hypothetical protein [Enterococcus moraviensis]EOH95925.1 hypothetical protein UAY_03351 [Enterococcus moraviensis ATCC BAA-383]EOT66412.1 hypothetical protein I586_02683 [Enterococcus moraviensis ATCC BAA-383]OJG67525.1 hypothetical protein RV09_GL002294 [Enterococcus moraviensis]